MACASYPEPSVISSGMDYKTDCKRIQPKTPMYRLNKRPNLRRQ